MEIIFLMISLFIIFLQTHGLNYLPHYHLLLMQSLLLVLKISLCMIPKLVDFIPLTLVCYSFITNCYFGCINYIVKIRRQHQVSQVFKMGENSEQL